MIAFSSALHWDNASSCRVTKLPSLSVCVCVFCSSLWVYQMGDLLSWFCEVTLVRVSHTHTRARARTHTEMVNRLQRRYVHKHCLMHPSGSEGWRIIRPEEQFNKVGLFWMCSITSCHLFFTDWTCPHVSMCEEHLAIRRMHPNGAKKKKKNKDRRLSQSSLYCKNDKLHKQLDYKMHSLDITVQFAFTTIFGMILS